MSIEVKIKKESGEIDWDYIVRLENTNGKGPELSRTCTYLEKVGILTKPRVGSFFFVDRGFVKRIFLDYEFTNEEYARTYQKLSREKNLSGKLELAQRLDV
ncbi:hypothetical protein HY448_01750 [Candidatus Pacearchaeota archaeon]|nr:hypothetical protein [Candidatus Pacearchaeota archaeon]